MIELLPMSLTRSVTLKQKAFGWLAATGAGVENEDFLWECVSKICPYCYELEPRNMDRASICLQCDAIQIILKA